MQQSNTQTADDVKPPVFIDLLVVKAGRTTGVYLQGEVKGEVVYMPLTPDSARRVASELSDAAEKVEQLAALAAPGKGKRAVH